MSIRTIAIIGGLAMDLLTVADRLPESGETITSTSFSKHPGGKGANSAVAAFRLSHVNQKIADAPIRGLPDVEIRVRMVGAVGDDEFGAPLIEILRSNGVDITDIQILPGKSTGVCVVIVESDYGENRILFNPGANHDLQPADFLTFESLAGGVRPDLIISQLEMRRDTVEQIVETASREGIEVLLNPAPAQYLLAPVYKMITHLVVNETEAAQLSGRQMEEMEDVAGLESVTNDFLRLGVKNVVLTLGPRGAYFSNEIGGGGLVEAEKDVKVVDTTGAGDTFVGAYAVEYIRQKYLGKWDLRRGVQCACKASARTIEQIGALEPIPWADEVGAISE